MNRSAPGLPVHHQLPEFTQTHVHRVGDAIQPPHPLLSPSPPAPNPSQHQNLFQWVNSSHEVAKVKGVSSFFPKSTQGWSPLQWTGWISLQSKGLSRVFSNTIITFQFSHEGSFTSEGWSDLPKVTQLLSYRALPWTQGCYILVARVLIQLSLLHTLGGHYPLWLCNGTFNKCTVSPFLCWGASAAGVAGVFARTVGLWSQAWSLDRERIGFNFLLISQVLLTVFTEHL